MKYLNLEAGTEEDISCNSQIKKRKSIIPVLRTHCMPLRFIYLFSDTDYSRRLVNIVM